MTYSGGKLLVGAGHGLRHIAQIDQYACSLFREGVQVR